MTEQQLLEAFVSENDPEALRTLVERHAPLVLSVCRSLLVDPADVDDAFQKTFAMLARDASRLKEGESLGPWLHRAALLAAKQVRARALERSGPPRDLCWFPWSGNDEVAAVPLAYSAALVQARLQRGLRERFRRTLSRTPDVFF